MQDIRSAYRNGFKSPVLVANCGWGKSCTAAEIAKLSTEKQNRVLVIAHRIELIEQLTETFTSWGVDMTLCDVMMVQSASRRLNRLPEYDFIICDECHHSVCNTYQKIFQHFPKAKRLLLTATPQRTNGQGLADVADVMIQSVSVKWLIEHNYLAPFEYYAPKQMINTEEIPTVMGDYEQSATVAALDKPMIYGDVLTEYKKYADSKQTIVFASSIEHSKRVCAAFNDSGYTARHIDGSTDRTERKAVMDGFRNGEIKILCNYEIISEGVSVDGCECCILLRPTQSLILFLQSSQRCMRYKPGKTAIILDFVGNFERHGLPDADREWTLGAARTKRNRELNEVKARTCKACYRTYQGVSRVCPYCGADNGMTRNEIQQQEQAELERIETYEKKQKRMEVGQCKTMADLRKIAKERGYNMAWCFKMAKIKNIRTR